jgi:hypothetical protein
MFVVISPWQRLFQAGLIAIVGGILFYAARHSPPDSERAIWFALVTGVALELLAAWIAFTALRWMWAGARIFFQGPK